MGSILYIKQCPPRGGDTLFASMYTASEALSDRMKAYLDGLTAVHDGEEDRIAAPTQTWVSPTSRPIRAPNIRSSAPTRSPAAKALYVNRGFTSASWACLGMRARPSCPTSTVTPRTRCSSAVSAGGKIPSRSGTTAVFSIARCGTTGHTPDPASG